MKISFTASLGQANKENIAIDKVFDKWLHQIKYFITKHIPHVGAFCKFKNNISLKRKSPDSACNEVDRLYMFIQLGKRNTVLVLSKLKKLTQPQHNVLKYIAIFKIFKIVANNLEPCESPSYSASLPKHGWGDLSKDIYVKYTNHVVR